MGALESALGSLARIADALEAIAAMMKIHAGQEPEGPGARSHGVRPAPSFDPSDSSHHDPIPESPSTDPGRLSPLSKDGESDGETVRGAAHGVSNFRFYSLAPRVVRRLLRDERAIQTGVLTSTLDQELGIRHGMRTLVLARLRIECGFLNIAEAPRGVAPYVRITDLDGARKWLAEHEKEVPS